MKKRNAADYFFVNCSPDNRDLNSNKATITALKAVLPQVIEHELTQQQRKCLELRFCELLSQSEIAEKLGLSQPTVSRHLKKAIRTVSNRLQYCKSALSRANAAWLKYNE